MAGGSHPIDVFWLGLKHPAVREQAKRLPQFITIAPLWGHHVTRSSSRKGRHGDVTHTHSASVKAAVLTGVALLLLIPLALLASLVTERTAQRDAAVQSVARGWGDRQWVGGPLLAIPVTVETDPARTCDWYVLPEQLDISVELQVQGTRRRLGLYDVPVYIARVRAKGEFDLPSEITRLPATGRLCMFISNRPVSCSPSRTPEVFAI